MLTHVADDGCGISEEKLMQLFQPFFQRARPVWGRKNTGFRVMDLPFYYRTASGTYLGREQAGRKGTVLSFALPACPAEDTQKGAAQ